MTIEVFKFLNEKMSKLGEDREIARPNNTGSIGGNKTKSRKRSAEDFILSDHPGNKVHIPNSANQKSENPFENPEIVEFDFDDSSEKNSDSFVVKPCEAPISKNDKAESKEEKDEAEEIEDIEVIAISSNADDDGIKMETIEVHEEDDDTMTIDKSAEAAMQILNGLNPMAINPLLPPHMTDKLAVHDFSSTNRGKVNVKIIDLVTKSIHTYNISSASKSGYLCCRCCRSYTASTLPNRYEQCPARISVKVDPKFIVSRQTAKRIRYEISDNVLDRTQFSIKTDCYIPPDQNPQHTCQYFKVIKAIK